MTLRSQRRLIVWRELTPVKLNDLKSALIIDVRSPSEHKAESIPAAINIPLLCDQERAVVGTIYKEKGELIARRHALSLIAPKVPSIIEEILTTRHSHRQPIVVYCWRGGLRSEAVASLLSIAGVECFRLQGGYKSWRRQLLDDFALNLYSFETVVLHGLTGVGKTEILKALHQHALKVVDLESLASHRGSVFGGMGLECQPSQKNFEAALWLHLRELGDDIVFMEAESRKIGRLSLPQCIYDRIQSGRKILVTGSTERRVERIALDYLKTDSGAQMVQALENLEALKSRLGAAKVTQLKQDAEDGQIRRCIETLLVGYYDPLYSRYLAGEFELVVSGDDPVSAADAITKWTQACDKAIPANAKP